MTQNSVTVLMFNTSWDLLIGMIYLVSQCLEYLPSYNAKCLTLDRVIAHK